MKNIVVLGSTGSVGKNALDVIKSLDGYCLLYGIVAKSNWKLLVEQIHKFSPAKAAIVDSKAYKNVKEAVNNTEILCGIDGVKEVISSKEASLVLSAIGGSDGLPLSIHTLKSKKTLALANKESLVMAGQLLLEYAKEYNVEIIPVDSEHSAIFQAIKSDKQNKVHRIFLTASGGPFTNYNQTQLEDIMPQDALKHPVWDMGKKITIDSATMMNKALEIVEAKWLFNLEPHQIEIIIHPQSIIHSMVEFCDGSVMAQMSLPDMKIPIQYAITYPMRMSSDVERLDLTKVQNLTFQKPDFDKFPALELGYKTAETGGTMGAVLNASNEVAVSAFLNKTIKFLDIVNITKDVMERHKVIQNPTLDDIMKADNWARDIALDIISNIRSK